MTRLCLFFLAAICLSGCAGMPTLETVTITPGASTTQQLSNGRQIYSVGGTVGFQFRIPHKARAVPDPAPLPSPAPAPAPAVPGTRGSAPFYRPAGFQ